MQIADCGLQSAELNGVVSVRAAGSALRALIWKEWRQQRWVFLLLAGLAYGLLVFGELIGHNSPYEESHGELIMMAGAFLLAAAALIVLSANAFCGERDDDSEQFLQTVPCTGNKIFWAKLGFVLMLAILGLIPLGVWGLFAMGFSIKLFPHEMLLVIGGITVLVSVPALMASVCGSVISTVLVSIPVSAACLALTRAVPDAGAGYLFIPGERFLEMYMVLAGATLLLSARRLWVKRDRTQRKCAPALILTGGLLLAYAAVPILATWGYVTYCAPLSFFRGKTYNHYWPAPCSVLAPICSVAPNGDYLIVCAGYTGWGRHGMRCALVDVGSGRTRWLSRIRDSVSWDRGSWSPSGGAFVFGEWDELLWLPKWGRVNSYSSAKATFYTVDARTGERRDLNELCPGLPQEPFQCCPLVGWYSDHVIAFTDGRDVLFADLKHHTVQRCEGGQPYFPSVMPATQRGIYGGCSGTGKLELRILRFAPELSEAESLVPHGLVGSLNGVIKASTDGQWLLLGLATEPASDRSYCLARAERDMVCTMLTPGGASQKGLIPDSWRVGSFVPGRHQILVYGEAETKGIPEVGLLDAVSHDLRRIALAGFKGWQIRYEILSPKGGFALLCLIHPVDPGNAVEVRFAVVDLRLGTSWAVNETGGSAFSALQWAGEDRLLAEVGGNVWTLNRDGSGMRAVLK